ncbi:GNAT family N-acetyltransferase [Halpernia sp.]|uniref:GNAT family N-acetyltransferase n=1 Tax=Halpernia sp. TaxID=2782209 RepID=UPI003A954452
MKLLTKRLVLKPISEDDVQDILTIRSNATINKYIGRKPPKSIEDALDFILKIKNNNQKIVGFFGITLKNNSHLIGTICLWNFSKDQKTAELGYEMLPEFHGNGFMFEALKAILNYGFNDLSLLNIEAFTHKNNLKSIQLLEKFSFALNENRVDEDVKENIIFELNKV